MVLNLRMLMATSAIVSLSACGGSGGNGPDGLISESEQALRIFADTDGDGDEDQDIADVLDSDRSFASREVSEASWIENYGDGATTRGGYVAVNGSFAIRGDGDDLVVTFSDGNGIEETFRIEDARSITDNSVSIEAGGIFFDMFVDSGLAIGDLLDSSSASGYSVRIGVYYNEIGTDVGFQSENIIGVETQDAMIDALQNSNTSVDYLGYASLRIGKVDEDWSYFNANVFGDLSMTADFGSGTVSGAIDNLDVQVRAGTDVEDEFQQAGRILLNDAEIQANAFEGEMTPDAELLESNPELSQISDDMQYSGAFYGPEADSVGGTMQGRTTVDGQGYVVIGGFSAREDIP